MKTVKTHFPEGVLYARVDQLTTYQDYQPYELCLRLIGVDTKSFCNEEFNSEMGCPTFLVDVNLRRQDLAALGLSGNAKLTDSQLHYLCSMPQSGSWKSGWLRVTYTVATVDEAHSYGYPLFRNAEPTYLRIASIDPVPGPDIAPVAAKWDNVDYHHRLASKPVKFTGFHVGQGMCSLLQTDTYTYLLDAGAGTPVKREIYRAGKHPGRGSFVNELKQALGYHPVSMVLSHPDSDHWRLLDWDEILLSKIDMIFVPQNVADIALNDSAIKDRIEPITSFKAFDHAGNVFLESFRSAPKVGDSNGHCLVSDIRINGRRALMPGDYTYERMQTDANAAIVNLTQHAYDAVIVPHHGDRHSALGVVQPARPEQSIAFFSAGNHLGYHHPRAESLSVHHENGFDVVSKKWVDNIVAIDLI